MQRLRSLTALCAVTFTVTISCSVDAGDRADPKQSNAVSPWRGSWELSKEFNRLLGFDDRRDNAIYDHPLSYQLSLDKAVGEKMKASVFAMYRDTIFKPMGHRIVGTGEWETTFDVDPGIETACFVTQADGSTFLWVGAPYAVVFGGRVSYIKGVDEEHDVMVIDFNVTAKRRTSDSVVYKRKVK